MASSEEARATDPDTGGEKGQEPLVPPETRQREARATDPETGGQKGRKLAQGSLFPPEVRQVLDALRSSPLDDIQRWWHERHPEALVRAALRAAYRLGPRAEEVLAQVYGYGATKYAPRNWERGYPWSWAYDAALRHAWAAEAGEWTDPESGLPHWAHFLWHCLTLLNFTRTHPDKDDRPFF